MEKPLEISRYCIPFTPFRKKLEECSICLVTTAAVRTQEDVPFKLEGDTSFRVISPVRSSPATTPEDALDAIWEHSGLGGVPWMPTGSVCPGEVPW